MEQPQHLELLVEDLSMKAFLDELLPRLLPESCTFDVHAFQGKENMLKRLGDRLRGYQAWIPSHYRLIIVVDRDDEECQTLKAKIEHHIAEAGLRSRSTHGPLAWQAVSRIAIEELEAWYFGDWEAVQVHYPRLSATVPDTASFRDSDAISGGTWERLEQLMKKAGYAKGGLQKVALAREVASSFDPDRCRSPSFAQFYAALQEATR